MNKTADEWMVEIDNALHFRKEYGYEDSWDGLWRGYLHHPQGATAVGPNLYYSYGDALMSMLTVPDPEILVSPESSSAVQKAPILERVDNQLVQKLQLKKHVDDGLLYAYLCGKLILKIGYDSLYGYNPYYDIGSRGQYVGATLTMFSSKGQRLEYGSQKPGWPWIRAVDPKNFVVPWGTRDIDSAHWCAHRFVRRVDHIKKDPKYRNTRNLDADMNMEEYMKSFEHVGAQRMKYSNTHSLALAQNRQAAFREFWEISDMETNKVIVVSPNYDKKLRDDPNPIMISMNRLPFVTGELVRNPRSFWSPPLAYYLKQIQSTQFDISFQQEKERRINVLKFLVRKDVMTQEQLTRIMSGDVGAYEEVNIGSSLSLRDVIAIMPTSQLGEYALLSENNRRDARDMVGFSRNQVGEYDASSRRTAREATFVQQGSERRSNKREQMISGVYTDAIERSNHLVFDFWVTPREVMLENGWLNITGAQLKGEYSYGLSLSTKRNLSKAERMIEALQVLIQFAQLPGANLPELYRHLMNAANDPSFERLLPAPGSNQGGRSPAGGLPTIPGNA